MNKHFTLNGWKMMCCLLFGALFFSTSLTAQNTIASRTVINTIECNNDIEYGLYIVIAGEDPFHAFSWGNFTEYSDGTAKLIGTVTNNENSSIQFNVDINLSGRTFTTPTNSPKEHSCSSPNSDDWYYYTTTSGTITGVGNSWGTIIDITGSIGPVFQLGNGANVTNDGLAFGGSSWLTLAVVSQNSWGPQIILNTNNNTPNGDINIDLSGEPLTPPTTSTCDNVTASGTIGGTQTICSGTAAATLTNNAAPTGGSGSLEYLWLSSTDACPTSLTQQIAGANAATYNPGVLNETTYFVRCSRRAGCDDWTQGESNCVTVAVDNTPNCGNTGGDCSVNATVSNIVATPGSDDTYTFDVTVTGSNASGGWSGNIGGASASGSYNETITFGPLACNAGSTISGWIMDDEDSNCFFDITVTAPNDCTSGGNGGGDTADDCSDITVNVGDGTIIVGGLDGSPITSVQIFTSDWSQTLLNCFGDCDSPTQTISAPNGDYLVYVKYYTAGYALVCEVSETVTVGGGGVVDNDNDGTPAGQDCDDNNASVPTTPGTTCNDGNGNTTGDVIQADGCTCVGTPINTGCNITTNDISLGDGTTATSICVDGNSDPLAVTTNGGTPGAETGFIITDASNDEILALPANNGPFDLDGAGDGVCEIWYVRYEAGNFGGDVLGNTLSDLTGCFDLSNPITVTRQSPDGGTVALSNGATNGTFTAGDVVFDVVETTTATALSYWYIITDENDDILGYLNSADGNTLDLSGAPAGECHIWGWSYRSSPDPVMGANISSLNNDDCEEISSNFITIIRQEGESGAEGVDLKLEIIGDGAEVAAYNNFSVDVVIMNEGTTTSNNIVVNIPQPANVVLSGGNASSTTQGSYNSFSTFNWTVGTLAPGQSETLTLNYFSLAGAPYTVYGQVQSASGTDSDSTPGNGTAPTPNEDDEDVYVTGGGGGGNPFCDLNLTASVSGVVCNDNGTPNNANDDTFTFNVTVSGGNPWGWTGGGLTGSMDQAVTFGPYAISAGNVTFTIVDNDNETCTVDVNVSAPATCSNDGGVVDNDNDGVPAGDDCDDNDASVPTTPGTTCNDGNGNTTGDVIQADGCTCAGTPDNGGGEPDCDDITITTGDGTITIGGLDGAPITSVQIFTTDWSQTIINCFGDCDSPTTTVSVPADEYLVFVKYYTAGYVFICQVEETVTVGGGVPTGDLSLTCGNNISVDAAPGANSAVVTYSTPNASTTCTANGLDLTRTAGPASGSVFPVGTTTVTYQAMDDCGNTETCSFTVTVTATNANLDINCGNNISVDAAIGANSATVTYTTPTANTTCAGGADVTRTAGPASGSAFPVGTTTVTYQATDNCGNTETCSFMVTVVGSDSNVTISCPANITVATAPGANSATVTYGNANANTDCAAGGLNVSVTEGPASGASFNVGTTTVKYTATDACGGMAMCTFTVTVTATNANLDINCGNNISVDAAIGANSATVTYTTPTANTTCAGGADVTRTAGPASGSAFPVGTTTVTYQATDNCGNTETCSFMVTVVGSDSNVTISCPANITVATAPGANSATVTYGNANANTDCAAGGLNVSVTEGPASGASFNVGTTTVKYTATDACGGMAMCTFTVTVTATPALVVPCEIKQYLMLQVVVVIIMTVVSLPVA